MVFLVGEEDAVEIRYYTIDSLESELRAYEEEYGLTTDELVRLYRAEEIPTSVPRFEAFVWVDTHQEVARLRALTQPQPA
jgi:hypothetical protein